MAEIIVRVEGREPEVFTDLSGFVVVGIPKKDPTTNTFLVTGGLSPKGIGQVAAWLIRYAKSVLDGSRAPKPLGQELSEFEKKAIETLK